MNRKHRIGVVCRSPSVQMAAQYDALADLDAFEFTVLFRVRQQGNPAWTPKLPDRVASEFLPAAGAGWLPGQAKHFFDSNLMPALKRHNFDAVIIHGIYDSLAVWQAIRWCHKHGRPYLLRCDGNIHREQGRLRRLRQWVLVGSRVRDAAALLVIGRRNREYYDLFGGRPDQMFLAPWEIDCSVFDQAYRDAGNQREATRREWSVSSDEVLITTVGRLVAHKGHASLVDAVAAARRRQLPVRLLILGDGPCRGPLAAKAAPLGNAVTLVGNVDRTRVAAVMAASDVFALPSLLEPWGLVVNEAAICGLPLVLSDAVGAGEGIEMIGFDEIFHYIRQDRPDRRGEDKGCDIIHIVRQKGDRIDDNRAAFL